MAPHILDAQIPEVNPAGAPGGDFENIRSSPEMFGGLTARAEEQFGGGLEKAGNAAVDYATEQQTRINDVHAAQLQTSMAREGTDLFTGFSALQGQARMLALPKFKQDLTDLQEKYLSLAPSMQEKARLAPALGGLIDRYNWYASEQANSAQTQYFREVAADKKQGHIGQALLSWSQTDPQGFFDEVTSARQETRNEKEAQGLAPDLIEVEANKVTGVAVREAVKMSVGQGDPHGVAEELYKKYKGQIDPTSAVQIEGILNAHKDKRTGDAMGQWAIGNITTGTPPPAPKMSGPVQQAISQAASESGLDPALLSRVAHIESGGRPGFESDTGSYKGLFQLSQSEFDKYGGGDIHNPLDNARAAARKLKDEQQAFETAHGRPATPTDIYMIHQQGAAGYNAHLANPDGSAAQNMFTTGEGRQKGLDWSRDAIWGNIPDGDKQRLGLTVARKWNDLTPAQKEQVDFVTSRQLVGIYQGKMGAPSAMQAAAPAPGMTATPAMATTGPGAAPGAGPSVSTNTAASLKSSAYQTVMNHPEWETATPEARERALTVINQAVTAAQVAADQTAKARKEASESSRDGYVTRMMKGDMKGIVDEIANDQNLTPEARQTLWDVAEKHSGSDVEKEAATYGPGFWGAYTSIHAPIGDSARITDATQIYRRAGPGGDLTLAGAKELAKELSDKQLPGSEAEAEMRKEFLTNARKQITGSNEGLHIVDPKGDEQYLKFLANALPSYDAGRKAGKSAAQLLNPDSADYIGKAIPSFVRPMEQWFADTIHDQPAPAASSSGGIMSYLRPSQWFGGPPTAASAPAAAPAPTTAFDPRSVRDLPSLISAYRAGSITKAQADQLAIDNGWAARKPSPPAGRPEVPLSQ